MAASFIRIDCQALGDALLKSVTVVQQLNAHWWCEIECRQTPDKRPAVEDAVGKDVTVTAVAEDGSEVTLFNGFILQGDLEYEISGSFGIHLHAVSRSYLMDLTPRREYYYQLSANDVARKLAANSGLTLGGSVEGPQLSYVQLGETDFYYLLRLTDESEKWLRPTKAGVEICDSFQSGGSLQWNSSHGLIDFQVAGRLTMASAAGAHYDYRKMKSEVAKKVKDDPAFYSSATQMVSAVKSGSPSLGADATGARNRLLAVSDLETRLKKESRRSLGAGVTGKGISRQPSLKAGDEVKIEGGLDAYGTYGLVRVVHQWTSKGYENEFFCTPWKKYTNPQPLPTPHLDGVVPARVCDNNDPQGLGRIQVQYFWQEQSHTCWLRLMTPHAGADRGFMFLPELGDEVWVAFEEGDPERARILGSTWNGVQHPPRDQFWGGDVGPNDIKRIVTKSGHRITIVDKPGKNAIVVATPKHLKISLIENSDETGDAMLTLHSDGDIVLNAPNGRIHARGKVVSKEVGTKSSTRLQNPIHGVQSDPAALTKAFSSHPTYDPDIWNKNPAVKNFTNCYAYAANDPNGHPVKIINGQQVTPQPGVKCGHPLTAVSCAEAGRAALCDGMLPAPNPPPEKPGYYPVALVVHPGKDYHWYRMDSNGFWSSKPGTTDVTNVDASNKPIVNPENANRNFPQYGLNYSKFCGYFYVPSGGLRMK